MRTGVQALVALFSVVVVASATGATSFLGPAVVFAMLVVVLAFALRPTRPVWRGRQRGAARRLGYLARYAEPSDWAALVLAALAVSAVIGYAGDVPVTTWMGGALTAAVVYALVPESPALRSVSPGRS